MCTVRLTSANGCCGNELGQRHAPKSGREDRSEKTAKTLATIAFQGTVIFDRCPPRRFLASLLATLGKGEFGMEVQSFSPALEGEHGEHE